MFTGDLCHTWTLGEEHPLGEGLCLGQQVGRCQAFIAKAAKQRRNPRISAFVELQGDVTQYIKNFNFNRRVEDSLHEPAHGSGTLTLQDSDGRFLKNGRSIITPGDKVTIYAGFARRGYLHGDLIPRFTGVVKDPTVNTQTGELTLSLQDFGYTMKQKQTSGDWSEFNTPKLLVDELARLLRLGVPEWENETGLPSTYTIGNLQLSRRNYWKIAHGALLPIGYVAYFNANGVMQCRRRNTYSDSEIVLRDKDMITLRHKQMAELINEKSVDLDEAAPIPWSTATAGSNVRWGQSAYTDKDEISQALYDVNADFESEEMVSGWDNIYPWVRDSVFNFKYPKHIYDVRIPARPQAELLDRLRIISDKRNISTQATIIGVDEYGSGSNYGQTLTVLTEKELF